MGGSSTVDYLCVAPHPDDAELVCGGLLLKAKQAGLSIAIVDCTRGEMGTRGSAAERKRETAAANRLLRPDARVNLGLPDGHLRDDDSFREPLVKAMRRFRARIVLAPHWEDQHPDHAATGQAASYAAWLCGATKYAPGSAKGVGSKNQLPYRPELVLHYNNRYGIIPDLVVDVSDVFEKKLELAACYASQVGWGAGHKRRKKKEPLTRLSSEKFVQWYRAAHAYWGFRIGAEYGEAYCVRGAAPVWSPASLLKPK